MSDEPNTGDVCPSCNGDMSWPDGCDECGGSGLANPAARASLSPLPPIPSADGSGQWTPDPEKPDHYTFGPLSAERTITLTAAHVATLPTGERVELPAGTMLREDTRPPPIKLASAEEERAILPRVVGYTIRERRGERTQIIVGDADGRTIELMHVTPAMLMRAADRRVHGEETSR